MKKIANFQALLEEEERLSKKFQIQKEHFEDFFNSSLQPQDFFKSSAKDTINKLTATNTDFIETAVSSLIDILHQRLISSLTPKDTFKEEKAWQTSLKMALNSIYSSSKPILTGLVILLTKSTIKRLTKK